MGSWGKAPDQGITERLDTKRWHISPVMNLGFSLIHSMVCNTVWVRVAKPLKLTTFVQLRVKLFNKKWYPILKSLSNQLRFTIYITLFPLIISDGRSSKKMGAQFWVDERSIATAGTAFDCAEVGARKGVTSHTGVRGITPGKLLKFFTFLMLVCAF
jgi:hypothetical protein